MDMKEIIERDKVIKEYEKKLAEQLYNLGVNLSVMHFTGDSSFPTEYTFQYQRDDAFISGTGPTFDMGLVEFIENALKAGK